MTTNKDKKRLARERAAKTGESYSTALRNLEANVAASTPPPTPDPTIATERPPKKWTTLGGRSALDLIRDGEKRDAERAAKLREGFTMGEWRYEPDRLVLVHVTRGYEVDVERCPTSAEALDWIVHLSDKGWPTDATIGSLVRAMHEVIGLYGLCGQGIERGPIDVAKRINARAAVT